MGNKISLASKHVFENDLKNLNTLVSSIVSSNDTYQNSDYNFLSKDVCNKYTVVLEEELHKHLKVSLSNLGTHLYLFPNNDTNLSSKVRGTQMSKADICRKISNHYMSILYILCLVKYVYDIEHHGDYSVAGIIFRNIKVSDGIMAIDFCGLPQKDYSMSQYKIDFGRLEGLRFFTDYVLDTHESKVFIDVLRTILSRGKKSSAREDICNMIRKKGLRKEDIHEIEKLYYTKYGTSLQCPYTGTTNMESEPKKKPSLFMKVEKDNPIFLKEFCYNPKRIVVNLNAKSSMQPHHVQTAFMTMQDHYRQNVKHIEQLLKRIVQKKSNNAYELKDITKPELDSLIVDIKSVIKLFFIQSILDYQHLLDTAKNNQNIQVNKE